MAAHICGNFAEEGQCGRCKHFMLVGVCSGVCEINDYEDCMSTDSCEKYDTGEPTID